MATPNKPLVPTRNGEAPLLAATAAAFGFRMKAYETLAVEFAQALLDARWSAARGMLVPDIQPHWSAERLATSFESMYAAYADGPAVSVQFDPEFSREVWPDKQFGDLGWAYVSVLGDDFVEAVTVVVAACAGGIGIRDIVWGRP